MDVRPNVNPKYTPRDTKTAVSDINEVTGSGILFEMLGSCQARFFVLFRRFVSVNVINPLQTQR
jgi:hypothetical protein